MTDSLAFAPPLSAADHRPAAEAFLTEILKLMNYRVQMDFKDLSDGALGVALHFEGEPPGIRAGKRTHLVDCIQFILNKAVNRPAIPRRWVNLGIDGFPHPKPEKAAVSPTPSATPEMPRRNGSGLPRPPRTPVEATDEIPEDPRWTAVARSLAEKSLRHGIALGLLMVRPEDRQRISNACAEAKGVRVVIEGDSQWSRVAIRPDKPAAPKRSISDDDDGDSAGPWG